LTGALLALLFVAAPRLPERPDGRSNFVTDRAGLIAVAHRDEINEIARDLLADEGISLIVVTIYEQPGRGRVGLQIDDAARAGADPPSRTRGDGIPQS
jgi:hypothetical protein